MTIVTRMNLNCLIRGPFFLDQSLVMRVLSHSLKKSPESVSHTRHENPVQEMDLPVIPATQQTYVHCPLLAGN